MAWSSEVQRILNSLTPEVEAELAAELAARKRTRTAARALVQQFEAEFGPVPQDELARVRREWPRG